MVKYDSMDWMKDKNLIFIDEEKTLDKSQHSFLQKLSTNQAGKETSISKESPQRVTADIAAR